MCRLPVAQSQQSFESMDLQLRKEFHESLEKLSEKYNLEDLIFTSFVLQFGYRNKYCASDIVYAMLAILESSVRTVLRFLVGVSQVCTLVGFFLITYFIFTSFNVVACPSS